VNTRLRNEEVTNLLAHHELTKRTDFENKTKLDALHRDLEKIEKKFQFKALHKPVQDEEHQTWSLCLTDAQGAERRIDWALASTPEYRQMMSKHVQIKELLEPPFVIEYAGKATEKGVGVPDEEDTGAEAEVETKGEAEAGKPAPKRTGKANLEPVEKQTPRELFEYVIEQGRRDYQVQRYKGLGEMTATQLWETTMDPERRTLLSVKLEDIAETETIFTTLMGEDVDARRKFIEDNALDVKNLDI
jgi:DNA gyrase subunit B